MADSALVLKIIDHEGDAVAGAFVSIVGKDFVVPEFALISDTEGFVSLFLPAGTFLVRAAVGDGREGAVEIQLPKADGSPIQLSLTEPGGEGYEVAHAR